MCTSLVLEAAEAEAEVAVGLLPRFVVAVEEARVAELLLDGSFQRTLPIPV